jgi:hypothetical protein
LRVESLRNRAQSRLLSRRLAMSAAGDRAALLDILAEMPAWLAGHVRAAADDDAARRAPEGAFSLVEQAWHLADLEREGYGERIRRLRTDEGPRRPDFDGARVARERAYRTLPLGPALEAFAAARAANLDLLRSLDEAEWKCEGQQDGVGPVRLLDLPRMMAEHDAGHRKEIEELLAWLATPSP